MKNGKIEKSLKPSQRESITEYAARFGTGFNFEDKARRRKIARIIIFTLCIIALIYVGFFITDVLIRFTEIPPDAHISPEASSIWISSLSIQG